MQEVLEAHAALDPKPIETLEPKEARKQPTPVERVLEQRELTEGLDRVSYAYVSRLRPASPRPP